MTTAEHCRRAYQKAMQNPSIRERLNRTGRAEYVSDEDLCAHMWPQSRRYSLTRISLRAGPDSWRVQILCNGVEVDAFEASAEEMAA